MIKFRCTACQHKIAVPDGYAGKRAKCPKCGVVAAVPEAGFDEAVMATSSSQPASPPRRQRPMPMPPLQAQAAAAPSRAGARRIEETLEVPDSEPSEAAPKGWFTERNLIVGGVGLVVVMILFVAGFMTINSMIESHRQSTATAQLATDVQSAIREAESATAAFDFDRATARLDAADRKAEITDLPRERLESIAEQLRKARARVEASQAEYKQKIATGYVVRDGKLLSRQEQASEAARLKAEEEKQQEDARQVAEAARLASARVQEQERQGQLAAQAKERIRVALLDYARLRVKADAVERKVAAATAAFDEVDRAAQSGSVSETRFDQARKEAQAALVESGAMDKMLLESLNRLSQLDKADHQTFVTVCQEVVGDASVPASLTLPLRRFAQQ